MVRPPPHLPAPPATATLQLSTDTRASNELLRSLKLRPLLGPFLVESGYYRFHVSFSEIVKSLRRFVVSSNWSSYIAPRPVHSPPVPCTVYHNYLATAGETIFMRPVWPQHLGSRSNYFKHLLRRWLRYLLEQQNKGCLETISAQQYSTQRSSYVKFHNSYCYIQTKP